MRIVTTVGIVLLVLASVVALWRWLDLLPPDSATMAAGSPGSGYRLLAERYAEILAEDGIRLDLLDTAGSVENADRLAAGEADIALLQAGVPVEGMPGDAAVEAIAALLLEPVLLFERRDRAVPRFLPAWDGRRLAAGAEGSGSRHAWQVLRTAMGVGPGAVVPVPLGGAAGAEALLAGEVDAALMVAPLDAPYLEPLFADPGIGLVGLDGVEGLARRVPALVPVTIPAGAIDYARRVPDRDLRVLAGPVRMVAGEGLHPALVNRLVRAAERLHGGPSLLSAEGDFPSDRGLGMRVNPYAAALLSRGPDVMEEILPYWVAAQINGVLLLLVPVLFLAVPAVRALPGLYDWTLRTRIYRHYRALRRIDMAAARARTPADLDRLLAELDGVEEGLRTLSVPVHMRENAYLARSHVELIRQRVREMRTAL